MKRKREFEAIEVAEDAGCSVKRQRMQLGGEGIVVRTGTLTISNLNEEVIEAHCLPANFAEGKRLYEQCQGHQNCILVMSKILLSEKEGCITKIAIGEENTIVDMDCGCFGEGEDELDNLWCPHAVCLLLSFMNGESNHRKMRLADIELTDSNLSDFLWKNGELTGSQFGHRDRGHFLAWRVSIGYNSYLDGFITLNDVYEHVLFYLENNLNPLWRVQETGSVFSMLLLITDEIMEGLESGRELEQRQIAARSAAIHGTQCLLPGCISHDQMIKTLGLIWTNFIEKATPAPFYLAERMEIYVERFGGEEIFEALEYLRKRVDYS